MIFMTNHKMTIKDLDSVIEKFLTNYDTIRENCDLQNKITKMKCVSDFFYIYNELEKETVKLSPSSTNRINKCYYTRLNLIKNFPELSDILDVNKSMVCDKCMSICLMKFMGEGGRLRLKSKIKKQELKKF